MIKSYHKASLLRALFSFAACASLLLPCRGVNAQAVYVPSAISDITGLQTALTGRLLDRPSIATGTYWDSSSWNQRFTSTPADASGNIAGTVRTWHTAIVGCHDLRVVYRNAWNFESQRPSGQITYTASLEFAPAFGTLTATTSGTIIPITFGGKRAITLDSGGIAVSDPISAELPAGGNFYIRTFISIPSTYIYYALDGTSHTGTGVGGASWGVGGPLYGTNGSTTNVVENGASPGSAAPDITTGGNFPVASGSIQFTPAAVLGIPNIAHGSVAIWGDSLTSGYANGNALATPFLARALTAGGIPYINLGQGSETVHQMVAANQNVTLTAVNPSWRLVRTQLAAGCQYAIVHYGTNDLGGVLTGPATAATFEADVLSFAATLHSRGMKVYFSTILPRTGAAYSTTASQTGHFYPFEPYRLTVNAWERDPSASGMVAQSGGNISGVIDSAATMEANVSGALTVGGSYQYCGPGNNTNYFYDGTHLNDAGGALAAAAVNTSLFK